MNHSYKTCLLLFFPSFHSAVASAAKFSRHSPSQHTSFQRSPPTYLRMPFTKRSSYLIQIRSTLRPPCRSQLTHCFCDFLRRYLFQLRAPRVPLSSNSLDFRIAGVSSIPFAVPRTAAYPTAARLAFLAYLAIHEMNNVRVFNTGTEFDSIVSFLFSISSRIHLLRVAAA